MRKMIILHLTALKHISHKASMVEEAQKGLYKPNGSTTYHTCHLSLPQFLI